MENHLGGNSEGERIRRGEGGKGREGDGKVLSKNLQMISLQVHSLVACILSIIVITKVVTIKDPSSLNQDPKTSEHHMPGIPAQDSINTCACFITGANMSL